ncbi:GNAT family N-acetyltransferase [Sphingomonas carotinifaciens]|uniref:GNAT family N-acetyltransferase n=1 Tax=Sphingomonas carotinifaciens TaxID=1166323 RepID=UPI000DD96852|nr:GNAT family N-acetyltransferase [Sphingomonas carotinifaciens]
MTQAPTLHTDRLTLTAHHPDDLDALAAMWSEPAVYAMIGGQPRSREEVWLRLLRSIGQWQAFGYGSWVVRERGGGPPIGDIGLLEARRAIDPPLDAPELGWALAPAVHGRGFAGEALAAILAWADGHGADGRGIARTCCIIDPANAPSLRLAARLGYRPARDALYAGHPVHILTRSSPATANRA